jgi:hypothetical protein
MYRKIFDLVSLESEKWHVEKYLDELAGSSLPKIVTFRKL